MNIFITGVNSFVGKNLINQFKQYPKHKIYGCDLIINKKNKNFVKADIRSKNFYKKIPKKIDAIIHLAAISRDKDCSEDLINCYLTNIIGTLNVIEAAKKLNIPKIIFASTEWVYPDIMARKKVDENTKIDFSLLKSEYAKSKLISEMHLKDFYNSNNIFDISILRFGIIYGERTSNWSAVEAIFNNIKKQNSISVGSFETSRRFIHVSDICEGIIKSLSLKNLSIINLQGSKLITLKNLTNISQEILKKKVSIKEVNKSNPSIRNVIANQSYKKLNFNPKISLKIGLKKLSIFLKKTI
jgi:nucleoside-diphosphate-sugar epimerase